MCYDVLMNVTIRRIFLVDSLGALVSAFLLGVILPVLHFIKMPHFMLYLLGGIALLFSTYSFLCSLFGQNKKTLLLPIICANILYCISTLLVLLLHTDQIGKWDYTYFTIEIIVILILVNREWNVFKG